MKAKSRPSQGTRKFIILLVILLAAWILGRIFKFDVPAFQTFLSRFPLVLSALIFVLLYVVTTTFIWFGPKDVLRITSAIFFGATVSTVFVWLGEMVNAFVMFQLSRVLGRDYVVERVKDRSGQLDRMKEDASVLGVVAWRINPLVPFRLMDLGYGLTPISFRKYFWCIVIISFGRIYWLQSILAGIGTNLFSDMTALTDYLTGHPSIIRTSSLYFLAVAAVTVAAMIARFVQKRKGRARGPTQ